MKPNEFKQIPTSEPLDEQDVETQLDGDKPGSGPADGKLEPNGFIHINETDPKTSPRTRQGKDTVQPLENEVSSVGPSLESSGSAESVGESASSTSASANESNANANPPLDNDNQNAPANKDVYINGHANELDKVNANDTSALTNGSGPGDSTLDASESDALLNKSKNDSNDLNKSNGPNLSDKHINKKNALLNNIDV